MDPHNQINDLIANRTLFPGYDELTYYTQDLYDYVCDNQEDPLVLFKLKVYGYYAKKYKWTRKEADSFIENNAVDAIKHTDGTQDYYYDWGKGKNQVTDHPMHEPNLDHIDPKSLSRNNNPSNFRIRCARLNENKGNMNTDIERRATVLDILKDMSVSERNNLIEYINVLYLQHG